TSGEVLPGWQVAGGALARVVEVHRQQGELVGIPEVHVAHAQPLQQLRAAGIVPRHAAVLGAAAGRLAHHRDPRPRPCGVDRGEAPLGGPRVLGIRHDRGTDLLERAELLRVARRRPWGHRGATFTTPGCAESTTSRYSGCRSMEVR